MYHLDKHDRAVLGLALDTAMLSVVNAIEDTPITDMALEGYIFMLTEFKRINEKLHTFLTALEDEDELRKLRDIERQHQQSGTNDRNTRSRSTAAALKKYKTDRGTGTR